jgi:copper chaperone CopZ
VRSALANVDGVESVEIDFAAKTATVTGSSDLSSEDLISALEGTKFSAEVHK